MKLSGSFSIVGLLAWMAAIHAPLSCHAVPTAATGHAISAEGEASSSAPLAEWDADLHLHSPSTTEKFNVRTLPLWTPPLTSRPVVFYVYLTLRWLRATRAYPGQMLGRQPRGLLLSQVV
eukprot:COSAG02_NODE_30206_length_555_cov_1.138158_1_plen_119_part_10